jgi:hypothetical protein
VSEQRSREEGRDEQREDSVKAGHRQDLLSVEDTRGRGRHHSRALGRGRERGLQARGSAPAWPPATNSPG